MIKLQNGPAEGGYLVKRAPMFLRAVVDRSKPNNDVLDQLDDDPADSESVYVYKQVGKPFMVHLNFGGKNKSSTGFYMSAEYRWIVDVDGESLRNRQAWRKWVVVQIGPEHSVDSKTGRIIKEIK